MFRDAGAFTGIASGIRVIGDLLSLQTGRDYVRENSRSTLNVTGRCLQRLPAGCMKLSLGVIKKNLIASPRGFLLWLSSDNLYPRTADAALVRAAFFSYFLIISSFHSYKSGERKAPPQCASTTSLSFFRRPQFGFLSTASFITCRREYALHIYRQGVRYWTDSAELLTLLTGEAHQLHLGKRPINLKHEATSTFDQL